MLVFHRSIVRNGAQLLLLLLLETFLFCNLATVLTSEYRPKEIVEVLRAQSKVFCTSCQEYRRTAHLLRECQSSKACFLRCYSLYLAGEKRKEEERIELSGPLGRAESVNKACLDASTKYSRASQRRRSTAENDTKKAGLSFGEHEKVVNELVLNEEAHMAQFGGR